jgi:hypothetical protein
MLLMLLMLGVGVAWCCCCYFASTWERNTYHRSRDEGFRRTPKERRRISGLPEMITCVSACRRVGLQTLRWWWWWWM